MTEAAGWAAVGRRLRSRVNDLKLTKAEVIRRSGISDKTLTRYLDGEPIVRRDKERALCRALRWTDDSIELVRNGGEPIDAPTSVTVVDEPAGLAALRREVEAIEERVARLEAIGRAAESQASYKAQLDRKLAEYQPPPRDEEADRQGRRAG